MLKPNSIHSDSIVHFKFLRCKKLFKCRIHLYGSLDSFREDTVYGRTAAAHRSVNSTLTAQLFAPASHLFSIATIGTFAWQLNPRLAAISLSAAPLLADTEGKYPVPQPGILTTREY